MPYDLRYPMITGASEEEQLTQLKSYLYQLVEQLNYSLNNIDKVQIQYIQTPTKNESSKKADEKGTQATFDALKPLIIKSAEIVEAYYEEINERLEGLYVAQSDFGTFQEQTLQEIKRNSTGITQVFTNVQTIASNVNTIDSNVQNIDSKVKTIDSSVQQIDTKVSTIDSFTTTIGTKVTTIDSKVSTIDTELKTVGESVGTLDTTLKVVEGNVGNLDTNLKTVEGNVNTLDTNLKTVEGTVGTIDTNLKTVEGNVGQLGTNLQDTKSGIGANLDALSAEVGQIDTDLQGIKTGVDTNLKALTEDVGEIDSKLDQAKKDIDGDLEALKKEVGNIVYSIIEVNAHIKSGLLDYDDNEIPIYGLEVGQKNTVDGVEVFNKFARFTSDRLSFYDKNNKEVAYISDYKLYITNAEITETLKLGAFLIDTSEGFRLKYIGRR